MTNEQVERVARAIYEAGIPKNVRDYVPWDDLDSDGFYALYDLAMKQARAAIAALQGDRLDVRINALTAENAKLREALEPFAKASDAVDRHDPKYPEHGSALRASFDWYVLDVGPNDTTEDVMKRRSCTRADLRRARAALAGAL